MTDSPFQEPGGRRAAAACAPVGERLALALGALGRACAALGAVTGGAYLVAWLAGIMAARGSSAITMETNAALCLVLLGAATLLGAARGGRVRRAIGRLCAWWAIAVGGITLGENLAGWDLGIDQLLASEPPGAAGVAFPNRMGTPASACTVALGVGLLLAGRPGPRGVLWAQRIALGVCAVALASTFGYLYGVQSLYGVPRVTGIAWPTALALLALALGLFLARPTEGLAAQLLAGRRVGRASSPIRAQKDLFQVTLSSIGDAVLACDAAGRVTFMNPVASALTGWAAEEALGRPVQTVYRIVDLRSGQPEDVVARVLREGRAVAPANHTALVTKHGRSIPIEDSAAPIHDVGGRLSGAVLVFHDVTEKRRAQDALVESEAKLRQSFANACIGFAITSPDGRFLDANPAYCALTGYDLAELRAMGFQQVIHPEDAAANLVLTGRMLRGEIPDFVVENRYTRKDGAAVWVRKSVSLVRSATGQPGWVIALVEDVTERRRAEDALRENLASMKLAEDALRRHELVVQQSRDVILFMRREDGRILEANPAATIAYGYRHDELIELTIQDLRAPGTRALTAEQMREADAGGVLFETVHQRRDGSTFPVEVSSRGATVGDVRTLVSIVRDISERRRAEAREHQQRECAERRAAELDAVVDSVAEPLLVSDAEGRVVRANPALRQMLGLAGGGQGDGVADGLRSMQLEAADGQPADPALAPGARALRGETVQGVLQRLRRDDGTVLHLSTSSAPIRTADGVVGAVVVFADVTEQQRAAEALREADRRKTEFLAVLSHELRNPLAPIRNSIALMEEAPGGATASRAREILRRQTDHLTRLVDDLLDLTRITHGKIDLQLARLDVHEVVRQATTDARGLFEERGIELTLAETGEPLWVEADAARLAQMVSNLLSNALKFTPAAGRVHVALARRDGVCAITVRDTGVGIAPDDVHRIFEPFVQVERTRRTHGGVGIGLALVREMASKHGGSVRAESAGPGQGAEFVIELPLVGTPTFPAASRPRRGGGGRTVLVVEDNVDAGTSLVELLALRGYRASTVSTGRAGLAAMASLRPDVLICDIGLPDMTGHEVIRAIRATPGLCRVFAVALTGYAQARDREAALAAGFDAHLAKPPRLEELEAMLEVARAATPAGA